MTFKRGDVVALRSDEHEADHCESRGYGDGIRQRRYVVIEIAQAGFTFESSAGVAKKPPTWRVWPVRQTGWTEPLVVREVDMIATGETATEVVDG